MRIGIDYLMLSAGINTVNRGLGRYTQQQLREVLRQDTENEYVLFCRDDANLSLITLSDYSYLLKYALDQKYITEEQAISLKSWRVDPGNWRK